MVHVSSWMMWDSSQWCFRRLCKELHIPWQPVTAWLLESRISGCYFSCSLVCIEVLCVCIVNKIVLQYERVFHSCTCVGGQRWHHGAFLQSPLSFWAFFCFLFSLIFLGCCFFKMYLQCSELVKYLDNFEQGIPVIQLALASCSSSYLFPKVHSRVSVCF